MVQRSRGPVVEQQIRFVGSVQKEWRAPKEFTNSGSAPVLHTLTGCRRRHAVVGGWLTRLAVTLTTKLKTHSFS